MGNANSSVPAVCLWDFCQHVSDTKYLVNFLAENVNVLAYIWGVFSGARSSLTFNKVDFIQSTSFLSDRSNNLFCAQMMPLKQFTKRTGISRLCLKCNFKFFLKGYEFLERVILFYLSVLLICVSIPLVR